MAGLCRSCPESLEVRVHLGRAGASGLPRGLGVCVGGADRAGAKGTAVTLELPGSQTEGFLPVIPGRQDLARQSLFVP